MSGIMNSHRNKSPGFKINCFYIEFLLIFQVMLFSPVFVYAQNKSFEKKEYSYADSLQTKAAVDSTLITLIRLLKKEKFVIEIKGDFTYEGKIKEVNSTGIKLKKRDTKITQLDSGFITWENIISIRVAEVGRKNWLSYLLKHIGICSIIFIFFWGVSHGS